tara:strand:- start:643 stop:1281 length:639 start_codon:yes stop_codon:yes gene_type:complete
VEEKSLVEPGHFGSSKDNILVIRDFIDKIDLEHMNAFAPHISEWENPRETEYDENGVCIYDASYWWDRMCSGAILKRINPFMHEMVDKYIDKMQLAIEEKFAVTLHKRPPVLVRWLPGNEQSPHSDKQLNDGSPNPFPTYDINSIIYWNNDFEGGQFYYPEHDIELEIEPGMAVAHPGDIHYLHGVKPIVSGTRWTTPSFYTITGLQEQLWT